MIVMKNLVVAPLHLQCMLHWLQPYDCTIKYRPGKEILLKDALSGLLSPTNNTIEMDMYTDNHGLKTDRIKQFKRETTADPTLALA